jgi:hypothetical protein
VDLLEETIRRDLSVRDLELRVRSELQPRRTAAQALVPASKPPWAIDMERRLRESLGSKVSITTNATYRGQVVVDFYNRQDLERIVGVIAPQVTV